MSGPAPLLLLLLSLVTVLSVPAEARRQQQHVQSLPGDVGTGQDETRLYQRCTLRRELGPQTAASKAAQTIAAPYSGYQVLKVFVRDNSTTDLLNTYQDTEGVGFWTPVSSLVESVDVMVSPQVRPQLTRQLTEAGDNYVVTIANVEEAILAENTVSSGDQDTLEGRTSYRLSWTSYHRLREHHEYLQYLNTEFKGLCSTFTFGQSVEGRPLMGIKCGLGKREAWIDGGIHAREWISPAVVSYIIREFSENSVKYQDILREFTVYMVPILNPDGYEYSHTAQRMWRKNRAYNHGSQCRGVDLNRNFDAAWAKTGSSSNPCVETFHGPRAFSEPESAAVRDFIVQHKRQMEFYLSFHSYSQMLFVPYGYSQERPTDYSELERVARIGANALQSVYGVSFQVGQASRLLYSASGGSEDWVKAKANVRYSYTMELRDRGQCGFMLPARQIEPSGKETIAAVVAMLKAIL